MDSLETLVATGEYSALEPAGYLDLISGSEFAGWLHPGYREKRKLRIRATIDDDEPLAIVADLFREDVLAAGHADSNVGFYIRIPDRYRDGKSHCVSFFNDDGEPLGLIDAKTNDTGSRFRVVTEPTAEPELPRDIGRIVVTLDAVTETGIRGWAYDEATPLEPVRLSLFLDDQPCGETLCDEPREDVKRSGYPSARVGFFQPIPNAFFDDQPHRIELRDPNNRPVLLLGADTGAAKHPVFRFSAAQFIGRVDGLHDGAIRGWVVLHDRLTGMKSGALQVLVSLHGHPVAQLNANEFRADVADSLGATPNCGFVFVPPPEIFTGKTVDFHFKVIPGGFVLDNSPYTAAFPAVDAYRDIAELTEVADSLFKQLWDLRTRIKSLMPAEPHKLVSYDSWANTYHARLAATPAPPLPRRYRDAPPLVSIICPTYRPRLSDFAAAVESVLAQTYENWELIIVDDDSGSAELTACIKAFAARDHRLRPVFNATNGGISLATNTALAVANGRFVAFFDHDDLLATRALEYMVEAALRTGAKLLYCDEDKIDDAGVYSEPNLKPDWNLRLLLAQNYVCHLLFVDRKHLHAAGPLRTECDGAQDHDLILRLAAITPREEIRHVPELLYHWRKTPFSTAGSAKAKPYTVEAGIRAVSDHLTRRGLAADVRSPFGLTTYEIIWKPARQPKVTIIIPYREHVDMTATCLNALRAVTDYGNYEILLVDNWSVSDEALAFAAQQAAMPATRVLRVEEKFNYSRINNLAVASSDGELLLFMNNDVVVRDPAWLTQMVGEALADDKVGIVGNKLLYPNGLVQHGGIILGVGGIADHAHRGLREHDPGYMARAICAQELSAVTAACLLCRRAAFTAVGGFDEVDLQVAFNDVDLCLKASAAGYRIVWTPGSVAEHRESLSRGNDFKPEHQARFFHENATMQRRWSQILEHDPHYSRHFSRRSGIFSDLAAVSAPAPAGHDPVP